MLRILDSDMTIMIPTENVDAVGLRPVIGKDMVNKVYKILREKKVEIDQQTWNRRYREYTEKIKTGSVLEIAKVLRDLFVLKGDKELSFRRAKDARHGTQPARQGALDRSFPPGREDHGRAHRHLRELVAQIRFERSHGCGSGCSRSGRGRAWELRLGDDRPKALVPLGGQPILMHALQSIAATDRSLYRDITVVAPASHLGEVESLVTAHDDTGKHRVIPGGTERQDSVRAGLAACSDAEIVVIHDAARPFLPGAVLSATIDKADEKGAAVAAVPAVDTVKIVSNSGRIESTPPRQGLWLAQTPQAFRRELLLAAHDAADNHGATPATDDAALVEKSGQDVYVVDGDPVLRKITTPDDLRWAEWLLGSGQWPR